MRKILGILSFVLLLSILVACGGNDPAKYTVTFESNGGSAVTAIADVEENAKIIQPTNPTRTGFTFVGWYKDAGLTDDFVFVTDMVTANITLYAKWEPVVVATFNVTFQSNGGSAVSTISNVANNALITAPSNPTRANFTFAGWYKETGLTNQWNFATDRVTVNTTLYAKWEAVSLTDQQKVDAVYTWLNLANLTNLTNVSPRIIMPVENMSYPGVVISWDISHPNVIQSNGLIVQPDAITGDVTVTLTATISSGSITREKMFTATVLALPNVDEMPPIINETFNNYNDGLITEQVGPWMPVSGKTGSSLFTVVSTILGMSIPEGSKALKIEALTELQVEAPIAHTYNVIVIEVDLMQTTSSNGSAIHIQSNSGSPVIGFGLNGSRLYYRVDNNSNMDLHSYQIQMNQWYRMRMEIDLVNKTVQGFYYQDGQLMAISDPVTYVGSTNLQSLFIRSGSSTTTELRLPAYITNIVVNNVESLPRPEEMIKIGQVTGIRATVNQAEGTPFVVDTPTVYNLYGTQSVLTLTDDYTVEVTNPVDIDTAGVYTVTYTITNVNDPLDIKVVNQEVTIYSVAQPNVIESVTTTPVNFFTQESTATITLQRPEGTLYYLLSNNATEIDLDIIALGQMIPVSQSVIDLISIVVEFEYIHVVVVLNGNSNIVSHQFVEQAVNLITTNEQFYQMATVENTGLNVLMNDLDFTGFIWTVTNASFKGQLYGQGFTISNLEINLPVAASNTYGGIFSRTNGAYIENLYLDNITVNTPARAGILTGRNETNLSTFKNIVVMNSAVTGGDSNGVGGLIGLVSSHTILENITIAYTSVTANGVKNAGGVVGRVDGGTLTASDIYITNVTVTSSVSDGTDHGVGGFVGYLRDSALSVIIANRIVIEDTVVDAPIAGALIGYLRTPGTATMTDVIFTVTFIDAVRSGVVGRINDLASALDDTTLFGILVGEVTHSSSQPLINDLTAVTVDNAWWLANLESISTSGLWTVENGKAYLNYYGMVMLEEFAITVTYNAGDNDGIIYVKDGSPFNHVAPAVPGYQFIGWFTDAEMLTPLPEGFIVTANMSVWGKYETVPASTVTYDANMDGVTVDPQLVNYGLLAAVPVVTDTMHESVLKYVSGWTLDGLPFDFSTPITEDILLVAVWSVKEYTVNFEGELVTVLYGGLVTAPAIDPSHPVFADIIFGGWMLSGSSFDFNTQIVSDITLTVSWDEPIAGISVSTAEEFMYMTTTTYGFTFVLANDINFIGVEWIQAGTGVNFVGNLDGNHFTLSNITINSASYGGIFQRMKESTVSNLVIDNASITALNRAGILVAEIDGTDVLIQNIIITNSTVVGNHNNGVGGLIGYTKPNFTNTISHIYIENTVVTNQLQAAGGLIGLTDGTIIYISDINLIGITVTASNRAGGLYGEIKGAATANVNMNRIVIDAVVNGGQYVAGFLGRPSVAGLTMNLSDAVFSGTLNASSTNVGHISGDRSAVATNVFMIDIIVVGALNKQVVAPEFIIDSSVTTIDAAWWNSNIPHISNTQAWEIVSNYAVLAYGAFIDANNVEVTLVFGNGVDSLILDFKAGMTFKTEAVEIEGFIFGGWYTDAGLTIALVEPLVFSVDVTLYAMYTALSTYSVAFNSNEGSIVTGFNVYENDMITEPIDPTRTGYIFLGWYSDELLTVLWDFNLDVVTADVTLYAGWELIVYVATFVSNEGSIVDPIENILPGTTIVAPTAPTRLGYSFEGWYSDELLTVLWNFNVDTVEADMMLYAKWEVAAALYTVTFNSNDGSAVAPLEVPEASLITEPAEPVKEAFTFAGWFIDELFVTEWDFAVDTVTTNMTLYAKWNAYVPLGIAITTTAEFIAAVSGGSSDSFYLASDLDFTGVEWIQSSTGIRFLGVLDGNFKTISNITITGSGTGVYGGIFQRTGAGAVIKNLTIDTASLTVTGRAGIITGRHEDGTFTIENVVINNVQVNGTDANGVGLVMGMASKNVLIKNVSVLNSIVTSSAKNVALFIGRADDVVVFEDIYAKNSIVNSTVTAATDQGVSVFVGYTNNALADITITRAVIDDIELRGRSIGTLVGYFRFGNLTVTDVFLNVEYNYVGSDGLHGIIGRRNVDANTTSPVLMNVFEHSMGMQVGDASVQLAVEFMIADLASLNQAWWDLNISAFSSNYLWSYDDVSKLYKLN